MTTQEAQEPGTTPAGVTRSLIMFHADLAKNANSQSDASAHYAFAAGLGLACAAELEARQLADIAYADESKMADRLSRIR